MEEDEIERKRKRKERFGERSVAQEGGKRETEQKKREESGRERGAQLEER